MDVIVPQIITTSPPSPATSIGRRHSKAASSLSSRSTRKQDITDAAIRIAVRIVCGLDFDGMKLDCIKVKCVDGHTLCNSKFPVNDRKVELRMKCYYSSEFADLRANFSIPNSDIINLIDKGLERTGAGKSGSSMYWSADRKYIVKSLTDLEHQKTKDFFTGKKGYFEHMKLNPASLLTRYLGLIRCDFSLRKRVYLVLMTNVLEAGNVQGIDPTVSEIYDLKGSTHGRYTKSFSDDDSQSMIVGSAETVASSPVSVISNETHVLPATPSTSLSTTARHLNIKKDLNFVEEIQQLALSMPHRMDLFRSISKDTMFLAENNCIDYSLLLQVSDRTALLNIGLIDLLTPFAKRKKIEHFFGMIMAKDISCVPPNQYALRFLNFVARKVLGV